MSSRKRWRSVCSSGFCEPAFADVRSEFERNFSERGELGASICVIHDGATVVDLWGGSVDLAGTVPWQPDTMVVVFSCTKGATALCAHILASCNELDLDAPVAHYWPSFAGQGKAEITVRMLLNHQAGLPGLSVPLPDGALNDFDAMVTLIERERPLWQPGTTHGYHAVTFGWLVGEVIRRVSGESVGSFLRRHVAEPLGVDFWIGLPPSEEHRVARTVLAQTGAAAVGSHVAEALAQDRPIQRALANSLSDFLTPGACDAQGTHHAEIPASNGIANARALARIYAALALGGEIDGVRLVDEDQIAQMGATESASSKDAVTFEPSRFSPGFEKANSGRTALLTGDGMTLSESAFGHAGLGGSVGFADPSGRFSFGYVLNRHPAPDQATNSRSQPLIDATYRALGHRSCRSGKWA